MFNSTPAQSRLPTKVDAYHLLLGPRRELQKEVIRKDKTRSTALKRDIAFQTNMFHKKLRTTNHPQFQGLQRSFTFPFSATDAPTLRHNCQISGPTPNPSPRSSNGKLLYTHSIPATTWRPQSSRPSWYSQSSLASRRHQSSLPSSPWRSETYRDSFSSPSSLASGRRRSVVAFWRRQTSLAVSRCKSSLESWKRKTSLALSRHPSTLASSRRRSSRAVWQPDSSMTLTRKSSLTLWLSQSTRRQLSSASSSGSGSGRPTRFVWKPQTSMASWRLPSSLAFWRRQAALASSSTASWSPRPSLAFWGQQSLPASWYRSPPEPWRPQLPQVERQRAVHFQSSARAVDRLSRTGSISLKKEPVVSEESVGTHVHTCPECRNLSRLCHTLTKTRKQA